MKKFDARLYNLETKTHTHPRPPGAGQQRAEGVGSHPLAVPELRRELDHPAAVGGVLPVVGALVHGQAVRQEVVDDDAYDHGDPGGADQVEGVGGGYQGRGGGVRDVLVLVAGRCGILGVVVVAVVVRGRPLNQGGGCHGGCWVEGRVELLWYKRNLRLLCQRTIL